MRPTRRAENPPDAGAGLYRIRRIAIGGPRMDDPRMSQKSRLILLTLFVSLIVIGLTVFDLIREGEVFNPTDVLLEFANSLVLVGAMAAVAWTVQRVQDLRETQDALSNNLARAVAKGDHWRETRQAEIEALGSAIESQFKDWHLSRAEIDIAGLMLKGASLKEIALARDTSEATIRQQAQAIYRKSGLSGRAELSAYFLESLFSTVEDHRGEMAGLTVVRSGR
ncbi:MAG: helix-turn-helix transcriptional regulator [Paracoccaceae bacterium]